MDHDFVLGSSQGGLLQPIQQQTWSLIWRTDKGLQSANTFFGTQPYSSPLEGTMFFGGDWDTVTDLIARSKADYDSPDKLPGGSPHEQICQHGAALIALYDLPAGNRFPHITTFFSRDLTNTTEDASGWIFAQGGPVYIAYRPFAAGEWKPNDWTGLLRNGGGGFISTGFSEWGVGHRCYVSGALRNGYVVQVAPVRAFASFARFQQAVRALPLTFSTAAAPEATFTALDGTVLHARYGDAPTVNGAPVDFAHWPLFDSPFGHATRGSQRLEITQGGGALPARSRAQLQPANDLFPPGHEIPALLSDGIWRWPPARRRPDPAAPSRFYASVAMTKAQKNSSTPADSGIYLRDAQGEWNILARASSASPRCAVHPGNPDRHPDRVRRRRRAQPRRRPRPGARPPGGKSPTCAVLSSMRVQPAQAYAATAWGPLRSRDHGETWQLAQRALAQLYCQSVVADRAHAGRVLLGTEDGLYVSTNAAQSWTRMRVLAGGADPAPDAERGGCPPAPRRYAGAGRLLSRDSGRTWTATDPGSAAANLYAVALHPARRRRDGGRRLGRGRAGVGRRRRDLGRPLGGAAREERVRARV